MSQHPRRILLASHGTPGSRAAELLAFERCQADTALHHLLVVPAFWKDMMGDDWLNNGWTRDTFGDYVESQLQREINAHVDRLASESAARAVHYTPEVVLGDPTECVSGVARRCAAELVIIGSRRPRGLPGYRSHIDVKRLSRRLAVPLAIAPYPR